ncbi:MAG: uroporphyrinogen-III synthase [Proteobacteria bacterium]|nr:uroporphyrinogen-III synthase [Pseudomonadota bacterium]
MRLMLTRPRADSERLATELRARGNEVVIEPMLEIVPVGPLPPLDGVAAVVVTSSNGIRTFAAVSERRDLTIYAVGDATALTAREAGFTKVESAQGDAAALGALIAARADPAAGALLHIQGRDVTGNLDDSLIARGYSIRPAVMYEARAADKLSMEAREFIAGRQIDVILFFSPRTARTFVRLVTEAGLADRCEAMIALCLSAAVAKAGSALIWGGVHIAVAPDRVAMLQLCDAVQESGRT